VLGHGALSYLPLAARLSVSCGPSLVGYTRGLPPSHSREELLVSCICADAATFDAAVNVVRW